MSAPIDVSGLDQEMTVEEYLKKECEQQIETLGKQSTELIERFQNESAQVREKLVERLASGKQL
jgi:hypothetical protein